MHAATWHSQGEDGSGEEEGADDGARVLDHVRERAVGAVVHAHQPAAHERDAERAAYIILLVLGVNFRKEALGRPYHT